MKVMLGALAVIIRSTPQMMSSTGTVRRMPKRMSTFPAKTEPTMAPSSPMVEGRIAAVVET